MITTIERVMRLNQRNINPNDEFDVSILPNPPSLDKSLQKKWSGVTLQPKTTAKHRLHVMNTSRFSDARLLEQFHELELSVLDRVTAHRCERGVAVFVERPHTERTIMADIDRKS